MCTRASTTAKKALKEQASLADFDPERWLTTKASGELQHDPNAAPMQSFGAGIRGCFGKRLAYLNLRLFHAYVLWNCDPQPTSTANDFAGHDAMGHIPNTLEIRLAETGIVRHAYF